MLFKRKSDLMSSFAEMTEIKKENKDKLYELDYMRFIACLAVMAVHISATGVTEYIHGSFPHIVMLIINRSLKFTTPVFIFLSGVTSFYSYRKKEFKYFSFLKRRLTKVLVAYFVWCIIYYAAYIYIGYYGIDIKFFIKSVLLGTMSYHLYFVIIIIQMYIVGPVFYHAMKNSEKKIHILFVAAIITVLCAEFLRFELSDRVFLKYMVFYMLGIYVTLEYDKYIDWINKNKIFVVAGYLMSGLIYTVAFFYNMVIITYVWFVFSVFSVVFVYYVGLVLKYKLKNIYSFIKLFGQSSYYIYLMHPLVLTIMILYAGNNGIFSVTKRLLLYSVTVVPVTIISCLVFTAIKNKIKKQKKVALAINLN
ncbi:acyltransferase [Sedimentibacter sp.]|uniref:acyltransferase n=1 Tax=Sedimentibacter sp. TaxID=1960295 RepID=UPI002981A903|nr:acyltransferase [Sedimentibacter sp.]